MAQSFESITRMELASTEDLQKFLQALKNHHKRVLHELDERADELQTILEENTNKMMDRFTARMKARRVARNLRRAADAEHRAMVHVVRTWASYKREYDAGPVKKPKKVWKF